MSSTPKDEAVRQTQPPASATSTLRSRKVVLLLIVGGSLLALLGWESRNYFAHRATLARLQSEMVRRKSLQTKLHGDELSPYLVGNPRKEVGRNADFRTDYYSWRGIVYSFHLGVEFNAANEVTKVEDLPLGFESTPRVQRAPVMQPVPFSESEVNAALELAEKQLRENGDSPAFRQTLLSVSEGLPVAKISTVKGEIVWNSFQLSRRERRLFAFQFTPPAAGSFELDQVSWVKDQFSAEDLAQRAAETPENSWWQHPDDFLTGVFSQADLATNRSKAWVLAENEYRRSDIESDFQADGVELPAKNLVRFGWRSLSSSPTFILWFFTYDFDPSRDFDCKTALFLSESGKSPERRGAQEICEHIGLQTNLPKHSPTPDGVRAAFAEFDRHWAGGVLRHATYGRILRPVRDALPELTVSPPGQAQWQKIDLSQGSTAAVRLQIPRSIGSNADLYFAFLSQPPGCILNWDYLDQPSGDLLLHATDRYSNSEFDPSLRSLTIFSNAEGVLKPGQEVVLWFHEKKASDAEPIKSAFITVTAVPHPIAPPGGNYFEVHERLHASTQPWSCGKLLGVEVPLPFAPAGCVSLGSHERRIAQLLFTPDSRRLVSLDVRGRVKIWNLQSQTFEGEIELPSFDQVSTTVDPESRTLIMLNRYRKPLLRWDLETRESLPEISGTIREGGFLETAAFGTQPEQLVIVRKTEGAELFEAKPQILTWNAATTQWTEHPAPVRGTMSSLVFLPSLQQFAAGITRYVRDSATSKYRSVTSVQLWPRDFSKPIRELPLGDHEIDNPDQDINPVRLASHPAGRRLAAICARGQLKVWDVGTSTELLSKAIEPKPNLKTWYSEPTPPTTALREVSLSHDGETVATIEPYSDSVTVWTVADGTSQPLWQADEIPITHVAHSSNGKWVATGTPYGVIRLWKNAE